MGRGKDKQRRRRQFQTALERVGEPDANGVRELEISVKRGEHETRWCGRFDAEGKLLRDRLFDPTAAELARIRRAHRDAAREGARFHAREAAKQLSLFPVAVLAPQRAEEPVVQETREGAM